MCAKNVYILNPIVRTCENDKYLGSIIGDSIIMCDEIIEETRTIPLSELARYF